MYEERLNHNPQVWVESTPTPGYLPRDISYLSPNRTSTDFYSTLSHSPTLGPGSTGSQDILFSDFGTDTSQHQRHELSRPLSPGDRSDHRDYSNYEGGNSLYAENIRRSPQRHFLSGSSDTCVDDLVQHHVDTGHDFQFLNSYDVHYNIAYTGDGFSPLPNPADDQQQFSEDVDTTHPGLPASGLDQPYSPENITDQIAFHRHNGPPDEFLGVRSLLNDEEAIAMEAVEGPTVQGNMAMGEDSVNRNDNEEKSDTKVICEYCGRSFKRKGLLRHQNKKHNVPVDPNRRPHRCSWPQCPRVFKSPREMKRHRLRHTGEKPFKCEYPGCDKSFPRTDNLRRHEKLHQKPITDGDASSSEAAVHPSSYEVCSSSY